MARLDDIIHLNVGGTMLAERRSTLRQIKDSKLATMFDRATENALDRDENNHIFLDLNPKYFSMILNYLRAKSIPQRKFTVPFPKLKPEEVRPFSEMAMHLGLEEEFSQDIKKFTLHGTWITIQENSATHSGPNQGVGYALSDIHAEGIIRWQLRLESIQSQMFIGVMKADTEPFDNKSYDMQGSYGWLLKVGKNNIGGAWNNGREIYSLIADVKRGDTVEILLNSVTAKISLAVSPVREFHMFLPNSEGWRLHINLFQKNDMIQILSP
jgi:hypothetical protein